MEKIFNFIPTQLLTQVLHNSWISCRNVTLSFKIHGVGTTAGPKPPILLVHDIIGNKKIWDAIGRTMLRVTRRSVIAIDLRNHGDSPHVKSHKYTHQASDVLELIDRLGSRRASLIGHGIGGKTAMCVALMAPQKIAGLLVIDISPISESPQYNAYLLKVLNAMKALDLKHPKLVSKARSLAKSQLMSTVGNDYTMEAILSNIRLKKDNTIGWTCNIDVMIDQYKHWISFPHELKKKKFNNPTLFVGGQLSKLLPPEDAPGIRLLFPKAVLVYVPKAGHYVQFEDPKSFLEIAMSFIKSHTCT